MVNWLTGGARKTARRIAPAWVVLVGMLAWSVVATNRPAEGDLWQRAEWLTYDARMRWAASLSTPEVGELGGVFIDDISLQRMGDGYYGERYAWPWPRHLFGRLTRELTSQGARAVAFDVFFDQERPDDPPMQEDPSADPIGSDEFFAREIGASGRVILAAEPQGGLFPIGALRTNAASLGHAIADPDFDNILRRVRVFTEYREWNPVVSYVARGLGLELNAARVEPGRLVVPMEAGGVHAIELAADGTVDMVALGEPMGTRGEPPFQTRRMWHLGVVLAAQALGLDLDRAEVGAGEVVLRGAGGVVRHIPVDADGSMLVDWTLQLGDERIRPGRRASAAEIIRNDVARHRFEQNGFPNPFTNALVLVGSIGTGNNVSDRGATPLSDDSMLVTTHWNVASMLLGDRFIHPSPGWLAPVLTLAFGAGSISLVWRLKLTRGLPGLGFGLAAYGVVAAGAFVFWRVWLPVAWPVVGGAGVCAVVTLICKVASEQQEARRIRGVFSRVVSPDVVSELLEAERLSLGGARREISVLFADVRGFTELTDGVQSRAEAIVRERSLGKEEAEAVHDQHAKELLETVNLYLGTIAEIVKKHRGVLDKYIGDCVMAFWGAPIDNPRHAVDCVKAAMDAQVALAALNRSRFEENRRRTAENERRQGTVEGALPMLPILQMGSGISTGSVIVGLMGSDASISNYTVFGREVNLANRLESVSGRGRIVINEATFKQLERWDPGLAAECAALPPVMVKGFRAPVAIYEVNWKGADGGGAS